MNNKFSSITIHKKIDSPVLGGIDFTYKWVGSNDGIVIVSNYFLSEYDNDLNNCPGLPWKMRKIKDFNLESWWMKEEFAADRIIQLENEISKLRHLLNQACDEIGRAYPDHRVKDIKKCIKEEMSDM